jgi:uncharacterized protein (TIGR03437 family)
MLCVIAAFGLLCQAQPQVLSIGYDPPAFVVAPGDIVTLYVTGIGDRSSAAAEELPLPTVLAGISVTLSQGPTPVPIFSVEPVFVGGSEATAVKVQIPYSLSPVTLPGFYANASLTVTDGTKTAVINVVPVYTNVHVVTKCQLPELASSPLYFCTPIVTHSDGRLVTSDSPAKEGETVVMYATGLGQTTPEAQTGAAASGPLPTKDAVLLDFNFSENTAPRSGGSGPPSSPLYAGLVPGYAGLYQVNVRIPPVPPGIRPCSLPPLTNLTISVITPRSFGGAAICVQ